MSEVIRQTMSGEDDTRKVARAIAQKAQPGDVIALHGDLGAGKSTFARAFIRAATGLPELDVPSPTFTIVQSYDHLDGYPIYHADLYRLESEDDLEDVGLEEERDTSIMLVEWPDRLPEDWLSAALHVTLSYEGQDKGHRTLGLSTESLDWHDRLPSLGNDQLP